MNANALAKHYGELTPEERFRLILAASARGDEAEQDRLVNAGKPITLSMPDHYPYGHAFEELALITLSLVPTTPNKKKTVNRTKTLPPKKRSRFRTLRNALRANCPPGIDSSNWPMLTWNPAQGRPPDLSRIIEATASGQPVPDTWSVGNRKDVPIGSRVFLHRQGGDPRGIVAAGFTTSDPAPDSTEGDGSLYVGVAFTLALDDRKGHLISVEELEQAPLLGNFPWGTQRGGVELHPSEAARVEAMWAGLLQRLGRREARFGDRVRA